MEKQNITLALPKEVIHKAKRLAVERRTSISAMLAQMVIDIVDMDENYRAARDRQLALLEQGLNWGSEGRATWTREELHER